MGLFQLQCRYYLLARRQEGWGRKELQQDFSLLLPQGYQPEVKKVGDYLEEGEQQELVEEEVLRKRSLVLDLVTGESGHSCCFTAGYTRYRLNCLVVFNLARLVLEAYSYWQGTAKAPVV